MTKLLPNLPDRYLQNPPFTEPCKECGSEAELGGEPWWEWWQHYICCSNYKCPKHYKKIESGCKSIEEIVEQWNKENKQ